MDATSAAPEVETLQEAARTSDAKSEVKIQNSAWRQRIEHALAGMLNAEEEARKKIDQYYPSRPTLN